ncbi:MAG: COX15/CtaA family protein, partial [Myxococcaceae bacterium]
LLLAIGIWVSRKTDQTTRILAILAVFGVALQGTLGGLTVLMGLDATLSTLHLVIAMGFFCLLIYMSVRLFGAAKPGESDVMIAFLLTFVQILLGGLIRHVGAGMACGNDWLSCGPSFWPSWNLGQLHMLHRLLGYALVVVIGWVCIKQMQKNRWAVVPLILLACQIGLGLWTVASLRPPYVVAMHTAVGALTLGSLWILYWLKPTKRLSI